jgi:hypothetical protein
MKTSKESVKKRALALLLCSPQSPQGLSAERVSSPVSKVCSLVVPVFYKPRSALRGSIACEIPRAILHRRTRIRRANYSRPDSLILSPGFLFLLDFNRSERNNIDVHLHDVENICFTQIRRNPHKIPSRKAKQKILSASCQAHLSRGHHLVAVFFFT